MRKYAAPVVFLLLLPILGLYAVRAIRAVRPVKLQSPWLTEEQWLVQEIGHDLAEMALFARVGREARPESIRVSSAVGPATGPSLRITLPEMPTIEHPLPADAWIWSPVGYAPLAALILKSLGITPTVPAIDRGANGILLRALLDARTSQVEEQNELVSTALEARITDPGRHEDAALLLGAFALREAADTYSDSRQILCRMAAHLAMARALRGPAPAGTNGRCAEALLLVLANRGAEAETAIAALDVDGSAVEGGSALAGWQRVLRLRLTQDWRATPPGPGPFLQRIEHFRALTATLGVARALQVLGDWEDPSPTWGQVALEREPDVGTGNRLIPKVLDDTVLEAKTMWTLVRGKPLPTEADVVAAINEPAERFLSRDGPRVIAWGTWAAMFQRHVCSLVGRSDRHLRRMLGLKPAADELAEELDQRFGKLTLYPLLAAQRALDAEYKIKPLDSAVGVVIRRPELVPVTSWSTIATTTPNEAAAYGLPSRTEWFGAGCPRGTAYEFDRRRRWLGALGVEEARARMRSIAPGDYHVALAVVEAKKTYTGADLATASELFGARLEYDRRALLRLSQLSEWSDLGVTRSLREKMCAISPRDCLVLGNLLVEAGDEAAAVPVFERALAEVPDALQAAHHSGWLVGRYLRTGRRDRAGELARRAGNVYSSAGLTVLASYLEKTGDYAGAERTLRAAQKRYPDADFKLDFLGLYHRVGHLRNVRAYEAKFREESRELFPRGLERVDLASLAGPPTDGALVQDVSPPLHRAHIQGGEVIVALDGFRVRSPEQYDAVLSFDDSPDVRWIVWRAPGYLEVRLRSIDRRFHFQMRTYSVSR